ncbi:membrane bound O-acyl transferase family-domain-containing protein [Amylocarpus encephaloides]|uniref:Membrane bound O-acyl transferase family-domain-containing protein n=1 Tax=Amylocarpus encephaloides TaxID=45428 RepID=A0A9P7YPY3_9HELO|nr:membrane bound O-acyl transferase family-domain-containing protein [Amylocarpus encephaloides]
MLTTSFLPGEILSDLPYPKTILGSVGLVGLQLATCVSGLGFTPSDSLIRPAIFPIIGASLYTLGQTCTEVMPRLLLSNLIGGVACGWLTQYIVSGLILKENIESTPVKGEKKPGFMQRFMFGLNKVNSQRNVGSAYEIVPPFSSKDPAYVPSRRAFLMWVGAKALGAYILLDVMTSGEADVSKTPILFAADKVFLFSRLGDVTLEELKLRASVSIGHWIGSYLVLQLFHSSLAFGTVALGFYEPKSWPPLFNSFSTVWSLRQYWGKFYHQLMRPKLTTLSNFFINNLLHLPKSTPHERIFHRYASLLGVFFFSGLCHVAMDIWGVIPLLESGALEFFCAQAGGIMLEDGVSSFYLRLRGVHKNKDRKPSVWQRVLGAMWVASWLIWTTPMWIYPGMRRPVTGPKGELLPFSLVKIATGMFGR